MKKTILYAFLLLTLSCANSDYEAEILRLKNLHQEQPSIEIKKQLVTAYQNFIDNEGGDKTKSSTYNQELSKIQKDLDQYQKAINTVSNLTTAIKSNPSNISNDTIQRISTLLLNQVHAYNPKEAYSQFSALFSNQETMKGQLNLSLIHI